VVYICFIGLCSGHRFFPAFSKRHPAASRSICFLCAENLFIVHFISCAVSSGLKLTGTTDPATAFIRALPGFSSTSELNTIMHQGGLAVFHAGLPGSASKSPSPWSGWGTAPCFLGRPRRTRAARAAWACRLPPGTAVLDGWRVLFAPGRSSGSRIVLLAAPSHPGRAVARRRGG